MQETQETQSQPLGWEDSPGEGSGNPLQYSCLKKIDGEWSLGGFSPWGRKESEPRLSGSGTELEQTPRATDNGETAAIWVRQINHIYCH